MKIKNDAMTDNHPITPPPELVQRWWEEADQYQDDPKTYFDHVATEAAQWGADQEMEACINYFHEYDTSWGEDSDLIAGLRAVRRPQPPSLKEQALAAQQRMWDGTSNHDDWNLIRRALEQLDD